MTTASPQNRELYLELLAAKALDDLSSNEATMLDDLAPLFPEIDAEEMARLTASIQLALTPTSSEPMPPRLRQQVMADAEEMLAAPTAPVQLESRAHRLGVRESFAWFAATAAALLALLGWLGRAEIPRVATPTVFEQRDDLLKNGSDVLQIAWTPGKHPLPNEVTGDVVWSTAKQEGFMRFAGLPVNDPTQSQYQLWIIDPERDAEPVDGGVFDVDQTGEVVVPIKAKLGVVRPEAFAITIEQPGGVVVSTQENLPLIAAVPKRDA